MNNGLTPTEADKVFNQMRSAMSASDTDKLNSLFETNEELEQVQEEPEKQKSEELEQSTSEEDESTQTTKEEDELPETNSPTEVAEEVDENKGKEPDELSKLKEQLTKYQKENQALKSQAGRVPFVQRQVSELTKKLEQLTNAATPSNLPSTKLTEKLKDKLKVISDTDPELAKAIIDSIATASDEVASDNIQRNQETLTLFRDMNLEEQKAAEMHSLLEEYPNAPEVFASDTWKSWKKTQSEGVQRLAGSGLAKEVSLAFELYAKDMMAQYPDLATPKVEEKQPTQNTQAAKVAEVREQRKASTTNVRTPSAPAKVSQPDNPELLFQQMYDEIRKKNNG